MMKSIKQILNSINQFFNANITNFNNIDNVESKNIFMFQNYSEFLEEYNVNKKVINKILKEMRRLNHKENLELLLKYQNEINTLLDFECKILAFPQIAFKKVYNWKTIERKINYFIFKMNYFENKILKILFSVSYEELLVIQNDKNFIRYRCIINHIISLKDKNHNMQYSDYLDYKMLEKQLENLNEKKCKESAKLIIYEGIYKDLKKAKDNDSKMIKYFKNHVFNYICRKKHALYKKSIKRLNNKLMIIKEALQITGYQLLEGKNDYINNKILYGLKDIANKHNTIIDAKLNIEYDINTTISIVKEALYKTLGLEYISDFNQILNNELLRFLNNPYRASYTESLRRFSIIRITEKNTFEFPIALAHEYGHYQEIAANHQNNYFLGMQSSLYELPSVLNEIIMLEYIINTNKRNNKVFMLLIANYYNRLVYALNYALKSSIFEKEAFNAYIMNNNNLTKSMVQWLVKENLDASYINSSLDNISLSIDCDLLEYIYGYIIGLRIYNRIKVDPNYINTYMEYLKKSYNLTLEEKLKFLDIDLSDKTLILDYEDKMNQLYNVLRNYIKD